MTKIPRLFAAALLAGAAARTQTPPADQTATLIANERSLLTAVAAVDRASFRSLTLQDGVWTTKGGFIPLGQLVNGLDSFKITKWDVVNPHVTQLDPDSAIVNYVWTGVGTFNNEPLAATTLASTVWTRRNGKWLAVLHQETDLAK